MLQCAKGPNPPILTGWLEPHGTDAAGGSLVSTPKDTHTGIGWGRPDVRPGNSRGRRGKRPSTKASPLSRNRVLAATTFLRTCGWPHGKPRAHARPFPKRRPKSWPGMSMLDSWAGYRGKHP